MIPFFNSLHPTDLNKKVTEKWTVKDALIHLVGWDREVVIGLRDMLKNGQQPWFTKTDDYEEFNDRINNEFENEPAEKLVAELEKWEKALKEMIQEIGEENLKMKGNMDWVFDEEGEPHFEHHINQIREALKLGHLVS